MRILHVYKDYYPVLGGIENHVRVLAEAQAAAGHQVIVSACAVGPRSIIEDTRGVRVVKSGRVATVASMPISLSQPVAIARLRPDLIHVQSPYPLGETAAAAFGRGAPLVISYQADVVRQKGLLRFYGPIMRRVLRRADRILANCQQYVDTSPWLAPVRDKITVVPLGVDTRRFSPGATGTGGSECRLLFAGRLRYYKGLDGLLRALALLPGAELDVCGVGPMMAEWQRLAGELGVADRAHFLGEVEDAALPDLYRRAGIFVLPANSRAEAYGTVLVEAMACGVPCVTTEVGTGTSWVVQDGVTGLVVPAGDHEALAAALGRLMADPAERARMSAAGRARAEAEFTEELMVKRVMDVYASALAARSANK